MAGAVTTSPEFPALSDSLILLSLAEFSSREVPTMESSFDILEKIDEVNFRWLEAARDLQCAKSWIEERQALSPGEYVVFDPSTQQILARSSSTLRCPMVAPKD